MSGDGFNSYAAGYLMSWFIVGLPAAGVVGIEGDVGRRIGGYFGYYLVGSPGYDFISGVFV